jgi:hypothetical protein
VLFVDNTLYEWRFAEFYANACFYTNRKQEAVRVHKLLMDMINKNPNMFSPEDKDRITKNGQFFNS